MLKVYYFSFNITYISSSTIAFELPVAYLNFKLKPLQKVYSANVAANTILYQHFISAVSILIP